MFKIAQHPLQTEYGDFTLSAYIFGDNQQIVLGAVRFPLKNDNRPWVLRVQYGCISGTAFHAIDCDCNKQIERSLAHIDEHGKGLFIYFRDHEAYGFGLAEKMRIVAEEKRLNISFEETMRRMRIAPPRSDIMWVVPEILKDQGIDRGDDFVILTSSEDKRRSIEEQGVHVSQSVTI